MKLDTGLPLIEAPNQSTVYQALSHDAGGTSTAHILMVSFSAAGTMDGNSKTADGGTLCVSVLLLVQAPGLARLAAVLTEAVTTL